VIDEVNVMSASELGLLNEDMCKVFDPKRKLKNENGQVLPFGGKKVVFLGDAAQLRPVCGTAIYDNSVRGSETNSGCRNANASEYKCTTRNGLNLYRDILSKNCIWLNKGFRNKGLLLEIMDRVRNGEQTLYNEVNIRTSKQLTAYIIATNPALFLIGWTCGKCAIIETLLSGCLFRGQATTLVGRTIWSCRIWLHYHQVGTISPQFRPVCGRRL